MLLLLFFLQSLFVRLLLLLESRNVLKLGTLLLLLLLVLLNCLRRPTTIIDQTARSQSAPKRRLTLSLSGDNGDMFVHSIDAAKLRNSFSFFPSPPLLFSSASIV